MGYRPDPQNTRPPTKLNRVEPQMGLRGISVFEAPFVDLNELNHRVRVVAERPLAREWS
jgi:hypothetical protein